MGGIGGHHVHPYAVQAAAFLASLVLPGLLFALLGGAWIERWVRARPQAARLTEKWQASLAGRAEPTV